MTGSTGAAAAGRLHALLSGLSAALLVVCGGMVVGSFAVPTTHRTVERYAKFTSLPASAPTRILVPQLHIKADVVPIGLQPDGALLPPAEVDDVGWWRVSAEPGARRGQTVITGHAVHTGGGAFTTLPKLHSGTLDVVTRAGTMRYRVSTAKVLSHEQLARSAQSLFGQGRRSDGGRLVLVTCANWNGSYWVDNYVVTATPLGQPTSSSKTRRA